MSHQQGEYSYPTAPTDDGTGGRDLPVGSVLGLLGAALVAIAVLLTQKNDPAPPFVSVAPTATPVAQVSVGHPPAPARLYYLVSDWAQAQELAEAFTRGAVGGEILLAGTEEQEARAWQIIVDRQGANPDPNTGPPRVIDLREPLPPAASH